MKTCIALALFAVSALCCTTAAQAPATNNAKIEQVLKDWKTRYERMKSVRYKLVGTEESFGGPLEPGFPAPISGSRPLTATLLIDLVNKRYRLDENKGRPSKIRDRYLFWETTDAYNGKVVQRAIPRNNEERNADIPDISIAKGDLSQSRLDTYLEPAFMAHGLVPTEDLPLGPGRFPAEHETDDFHLKGTTLHSGRSCLMLSTGPTGTTPAISEEFWTDSQRESAIVRQIRWQAKNPISRTEIDYQKTPYGWQPQKWTLTWTLGGKVRNVTRLNVEVFEANPVIQEEDFTLPIKPGMVVKLNEFPGRGKGLDQSQPATTMLSVNPEGRLNEVEKEGFRTIEGVPLPPDPGSKRWWWIGGSAIAVATISFCLLIWRRKQQSVVNSPSVLQ